MKRFLTLACFTATSVASAQEIQVQQIQVKQQAVQIQVGGAPPLPGGPGTQPKPREEVKVDPKTDPNPKSLEIPAEQLTRAKELVRTLAHPAYRERENATRELQKMGRAALTALSEARQTESSPEVRLRTDLCLPVAEADDMRAKVNCFLADSEAKYDHTLPGWSRFKTVVGNDKTARELFAEVLKKKDMHSLLMAAELPANELSQVLANHYREVQGRMNGMQFGGRGGYVQQQPPTTPEIIVLAFLESVYTDKETVLNYNYGLSITNYMYQPDIQNAMGANRSGKYAVPIRKVLIRWLDTRETSQGAQMAMQFAQNWQMTDDIPRYASRVLVGEGQPGNPWLKTNALTVLAQHKTAKDHIEAIAKVFDDGSVIQQAFPGAKGNQVNAITLGDFALGVALSITGQDPKEYGLEVMNNGNKWNQNNYFFKDEEKNKAEDKRKAAHKKWEEWMKKQKEIKKDEPKKDEPKKEEPKKVVPMDPKNDVKKDIGRIDPVPPARDVILPVPADRK